MRQIVLDTETTGLEPNMGHRIIEIGAVEVVNRKLTGRHFHEYINPQREIDDGALEVHGITSEFLNDKPLFHEIVDSFVEFVRDAELVIHNAPFDVSFLDYEFGLLDESPGKMARLCEITDSLTLARRKHPGQKNNLDALCRRYEVDNSQRELHGALLDAEILADVYLLMTGGQTQLFAVEQSSVASHADIEDLGSLQTDGLVAVLASADELRAHETYLELLDQKSGDATLWRTLANES